MPKRANEMTAIEVKRLVNRVVKGSERPGWRAVGGVVGLGLDISGPAAQSWALRVVDVNGKRRTFGLGSFPSVTLDMARDKARVMREQVLAGADPIAERRAAIEARRAEQAMLAARLVTFKRAAEDYIATNEAGWSNPKHAQQWANTLATYAYPKLGDMPVSSVATADVLAVLQQMVPKKGAPKETGPLWTERTETATRLRQRIEAVLDAAKAKGQRAGDNPAAWKGCLDALLPKPGKVRAVEHHAALPWKEVPAFFARLRAQAGTAARMLEFSILCASRSAEVRGAVWSEFDLDAGLWVIPKARMKAKREHRVPLSPQAVTLLRALPRTDDQPLVFPSPTGKVFSDAAMGAVLKRMSVEATQHGIARSSFRDWCAANGKARDLAERALAHAVEDSTEAAYYRDTLVEQRRPLMAEWAGYCRSRPAIARAA
jgi:integrase